METRFGLLSSDLDTLIKMLHNYSAVGYACIFGSRAKGNFRKGSDVDIALKGKSLNFDILSQIS